MGLSTTNLQLQAADTFIQTATPGSNNSLYLFLGQQLPWVNDASPPTPTESISSYNTIWNNMIGLKLVTSNDIEIVIPNYLWTSGNTYVAYTDTIDDIFQYQFYTITSNNEVYKCLSNNNGAVATVSPVGLGPSQTNYIQTTEDGYMWKYMFNVAAGDPFIDTLWIPVPQIAPPNSYQSIIQNAAVSGSIDIIQVVNGGTGYANSSVSYIVNITGDGTGANAYANVVNNSVQNITMVSTGENYTRANVTFTDPSGTGAIAVPIFPPPGGHGSSAWRELGGTTVMVSIQTSDTENNTITANNSFRQNGLIVNPLQNQSNNILQQINVKPYLTAYVAGGAGQFVLNETVYQGNSLTSSYFSAVVIDYDPITGILTLNNIKGEISVSAILYGVSSSSQKYVVAINLPDTQIYTGEILEINNTTPIQRQSTQAENFYYIINF